MFSKEEIKQRFAAEKLRAASNGETPPEVGLTLALLIMSSALFGKKQRSGEDYSEHPIHVGFTDTRSTRKQIVGILHDVIEDSDWTLEDLREIGFEDRIVKAVDALTSRKGEPYFDFIVRCGNSFQDCEYDAIDNKINDLEHNSMNTRYPHIYENEYQVAKRPVYNISYFYLVALKKGEIQPGTSIVDFLKKTPEYSKDPEIVNELLNQFSSQKERLEIPANLTPPEPQ
ncbi:MAG: hypothetical protein WBK55_10475 [Alphaproteobacteria bacterium]